MHRKDVLVLVSYKHWIGAEARGGNGDKGKAGGKGG